MKSRILTILIGLVVPLTGIVVLFPFWNRVEPFVMGFPFNYFWLFLWLFITSGCLYIAFKLDPLNEEEDW
ncbi:MAG: rane protein [Firmicutes bacterium]|nr:rane protein [Bacillota bacterium]